MERLTKKVDGVWTALCKYGSSPYPVVTQEIIDRLAAYEDTGLAPEEIRIQKEAMERMGWFGKMFQRYKGDPRGPIGTLRNAWGKFLVESCIEPARNRQAIKDVDGNTWLPMLQDEFRAMADFIERVQDWIPVEERLPEENVTVLAFNADPHAEKYVLARYRAVVHFGYCWCQFDQEYDSWCASCWKVTHWMPLPQPPKEEKK